MSLPLFSVILQSAMLQNIMNVVKMGKNNNILRMNVDFTIEWIRTCLYQNRTNELYLNQSQLEGNIHSI